MTRPNVPPRAAHARALTTTPTYTPCPCTDGFSGTLSVNGAFSHTFTITTLGSVTASIVSLAPNTSQIVGFGLGVKLTAAFKPSVIRYTLDGKPPTADSEPYKGAIPLAATTTLLLCLFGLPLAYWLAATRRRGKFLIEAVVALPLVLPPTVLGFYVLLAIGSQSPIGRMWVRWTGHGLAFTFEARICAGVPCAIMTPSDR